jgi:murein DD-endopeptidase MepM/ murein hydrolase activator NlpD
MAVRGLQAYAVPSARAGQRPDPSARRDVLSGLLTAGFLLGIIAVVVLVVLASPEYSEPASGADGDVPAAVAAGASLSPAASWLPSAAAVPSPTSPSPEDLKGYRWPVRGGGQVAQWYDWDPNGGRFVIDRTRVHGGIVITWWEGAPVKAAHAGAVVYAGRRWEEHVGYDGSLAEVYERMERKGLKPTFGVVVNDGNGYYSVYSGLRDVRVEAGQAVTPATTLGTMSSTEGRQMMRYQLVRMDGSWLRVADAERARGYPGWVREHVDPLLVLDVTRSGKLATNRPAPPSDPPRLPQP